MNDLRLDALDEKHLRISGIEPFLAHCLSRLPDVLAQGQRPRARARLFPDPLANAADANNEWHRLMDADLDHLFRAAGETVARDLVTLADGQLTLSTAHTSAWMSALNQARLVLGELHGVTEEQMNQPSLDLHDAQHRAILEIHLLGYLLHLFVEYDQHGAS